MHIVYAIGVTAVVVGLALWRGSLSYSGAFGAMIVGTLIFGLGGPKWGLILGLFFVTSSLLSHYKEEHKQVVAEKFEKGSQRDFLQVMANGGIAALLATLDEMTPLNVWLPLYIGIMATVTADTWATELGTLSKRPPRLISTWEIVAAGTSGGLTTVGTLMSLLGGAMIGLAAGLLFEEIYWWLGLLMGTLSGLLGSLFDSLLGATVQQLYFCNFCQTDTERRIHNCGRSTRPVHGWPWMNNDMVNLLASILGGMMALGLWLWIGG